MGDRVSCVNLLRVGAEVDAEGRAVAGAGAQPSARAGHRPTQARPTGRPRGRTTEETGAGWPDLTALGVLFPADFVNDDVGVTGFGPYASLDQALAPNGIGAATLSDRYRAESSGLFNAVLSPTGAPPDETACGEIPAQICDPPPPSCNCGRDCTCETPCEMVTRPYPPDFKTADRALAFHPGLAVAAGMRCVQDCCGLRTFRIAYKRYAQDRPGFQRNEPLPTSFYGAIRAVPDLVRSSSPPKH
jgi:hypothetical protein